MLYHCIYLGSFLYLSIIFYNFPCESTVHNLSDLFLGIIFKTLFSMHFWIKIMNSYLANVLNPFIDFKHLLILQFSL